MSTWIIDDELSWEDAATIVDVALDCGRYQLSEEQILGAIDGGRPARRFNPIFVARERGSIVGVAVGRRLALRDEFETDRVSAQTATMSVVAVVESARSGAIAAGLREAAAAFPLRNGLMQVTAQVRAGEEELFEAAGWDVSGTGWAWVEPSGDTVLLFRQESTLTRGYRAVARAVGHTSLGVAVPLRPEASEAEVIAELAQRALPTWSTYEPLRRLAGELT